MSNAMNELALRRQLYSHVLDQDEIDIEAALTDGNQMYRTACRALDSATDSFQRGWLTGQLHRLADHAQIFMSAMLFPEDDLDNYDQLNFRPEDSE